MIYKFGHNLNLLINRIYTTGDYIWFFCLHTVEANAPGSDVPSTVNRVVIHSSEKGLIKLTKAAFRYNLFLVTSPTQSNSASDSETTTKVWISDGCSVWISTIFKIFTLWILNF